MILWFLYVEAYQLWCTHYCIGEKFTEHSCNLITGDHVQNGVISIKSGEIVVT